MNNRIPFLMFAAAINCLFLSCSQTHTALSDHTSKNAASNLVKDTQANSTVNYNWLNYADPKADANLAIEKKQFNLLGLNNTDISFPGVDKDAEFLQRKCGYKLVGNTGNVIKTENGQKQLEKLYQYTAIYNQLVSAACRENIETKED